MVRRRVSAVSGRRGACHRARVRAARWHRLENHEAVAYLQASSFETLARASSSESDSKSNKETSYVAVIARSVSDEAIQFFPGWCSWIASLRSQ
jgi:hypothetical protein